MNIYPFLGIEEQNNVDFVQKMLASGTFISGQNLAENILILIEKQVKMKFISIIDLEREVAHSAELVTDDDDFTSSLSRSEEWQEYFFESYPELKDYLKSEYSKLRNLIERVLTDFGNDREALAIEKELIEIEIGEGDFHNGVCTCCLKFSDGTLLFYKPRSLRGDQRVIEFFLEQQEKLQLDIFYPVDNRDFTTHGWSFAVDVSECQTIEAVKNYYVGLGVLTAFCHALKIEDLIYDNIICADGKIALIDLECILCTNLPFDEKKIPILSTLAGHLNRESIVKSGIIPRHTYGGKNNDGESDGALNYLPNRSVAEKKFKSVIINDQNEEETHFISEEKHVPRLKGQHQASTSFLKEYTSGFETGYQHVLNHKESFIALVQSLVGIESRIIWRPTKIYSTILNESFNESYLSSVNGRNGLFQRMENGLASGILTEIVDSEIEQLSESDIPAFKKIIGTNNVFDFSGKSLNVNYYFQSDIEQVLERIQNMGEADYEVQRHAIDCSLKLFLDGEASSLDLSFRPIQESQSTEEISVQFLEDISTFLQTKLLLNEKTVSLLDISTNANNGWSYGPIGPGISNGTDSIGLFLLAFGALQNEEKALSVSRDIFSKNKQLFHELTADPTYYESHEHFVFSPLGFPGSLVYYAAISDELLPDSNLLDDNELLSDIESYYNNWLHKDQYFDFMLGACGSVILFSNIFEKTKNPRYKQLAITCADHVASAAIQKDNFVYWSTEKFKGLGGFSHGASSYSVAMLMAYRLTNSTEFFNLYKGSLEYDQSFYREHLHGFIDNRYYPQEVCNYGWAHGSAGIAVSRILLHQHDSENTKLRDEMSICRSSLNAFIESVDNYSINAGFAGAIEVLNALTNELGEENNFIKTHMRSHLKKWIAQPSTLVSDKNHLHLPMNLGISGLGYSVLRFLHGDKLPSYLFLGVDVANGPKSFYH